MAFFLLSLHNQLEAEMMRQMVFELARKQVHWYIPQPAFCYSGNLARKRVPREMQSKMPPPILWRGWGLKTTTLYSQAIHVEVHPC